jgi:hypothetical protein
MNAEELGSISAVDRAYYYYDLYKEYTAEAERYKKIYEAQMAQAISTGKVRTCDGKYMAYVSEIHAPSGDLLKIREPDEYSQLLQADLDVFVEKWRPKMEQLRSIASSKYGLKGKALEDKINEYCDPNGSRAVYKFREVNP